MASSASSPTSTVSKLARRQRSGQRRDVLGERPVLGRLLARAVQILPCQRREAVVEQEARSLRHAPPRAQRHDRLGLDFGPLVCLTRKTAWRFVERSASADRGLRRVAARRHTLEHRATRRRSACHTVLLHDLVQVAEMQVLAEPLAARRVGRRPARGASGPRRSGPAPSPTHAHKRFGTPRDRRTGSDVGSERRRLLRHGVGEAMHERGVDEDLARLQRHDVVVEAKVDDGRGQRPVAMGWTAGPLAARSGQKHNAHETAAWRRRRRRRRWWWW